MASKSTKRGIEKKVRSAKRTVSRAKKTKKPAVAKKPVPAVFHPTPATSQPHYYAAVGRRKSAVARIRLYKRGQGQFSVNGKPLNSYFPIPEHQSLIAQPMTVTNIKLGGVSVLVSGGGIRSQAESVRLGLARAILLLDPDTRLPLKRAGLLTRDARVKERKKYGLKRARRAPQWQKR